MSTAHTLESARHLLGMVTDALNERTSQKRANYDLMSKLTHVNLWLNDIEAIARGSKEA